jgi:hypothetical protein
MRDIIKSRSYYEQEIANRESSELKRLDKFKKGLIPPDRIQSVKVDMAKNQLYLSISKYSIGLPLEYLIPNFNKSLLYFKEHWAGYWKLKNTEGKEYDQYILSAYDEMLWMLSLGYLLNFPDESFSKLVEVIDRDNVKDHLFEFIIRAKLPERKPLKEESYREYFGVPKVFEKLRQAITEPNKGKSQELIKIFLEKEWYHNHKEAGWYNSHKSKHNTYFGYWSFEAAAVTCIMDLDDSSYRDNEYYPKDLVDYYRS